MTRLAALTVAAALIFGASAAHAQTAQWAAYRTTDEFGGPAGLLHYGVPQTDDSLIDAYCRPSDPGGVDMSLYINPGPYAVGQFVTVLFATTSMGTVQQLGTVAFNDYIGNYVRLGIAENDPLWRAIAFDNNMNIAVAGMPWTYVSLRGSAAAMQQFANICNSLGVQPAR